jgi:NAD-dependent SIR2 family protein deacetylase
MTKNKPHNKRRLKAVIECVKQDFLYLYCYSCKNTYKMKFADCLMFQGRACPECPSCKKGTVAGNQSFSNFCKYYDRFRKTDESKLSLIIDVFVATQNESLFGASFTCSHCHKQFVFGFKKIKKVSLLPETFRCPKCKQTQVPLSLVKSFFGSLRWVIELSELAGHWAILLDVKRP